MDWFPLLNSLRIALLSAVFTFGIGITVAYYATDFAPWAKSLCDMIFTLPLVLPPTVIGFFLLKLLGPQQPLGKFFMNFFDWQIIMTPSASVFATVIVTLPLMYRTARGAFESFNHQLKYVGQTLGLSNSRIFWTIQLPACKSGVLAGCVLAFARGLGEYGATGMVSGYTPGKTATISTTVYQLWRIGDDQGAYTWVGINILISCFVLILLNHIQSADNKQN